MVVINKGKNFIKRYQKTITNMENIKVYLLKLLLNNVFKYNESECRDKWMETTIDDIKFLIEE